MPSGTAHLHLYTAGVRRSEWKQKIRFTFQPDFAIITPAEYAPVAQLDRVTDSDSVGQRFESARAYHEKTCREAGFFAVRRGFEVYPREGKSARAYHKKPAVRQVFLLCAADSRFIPGRGNPLGRTTKKPCSFNGCRFFLRRCCCKKLGAIQAVFGYKMPCDVAPVLHQKLTSLGSEIHRPQGFAGSVESRCSRRRQRLLHPRVYPSATSSVIITLKPTAKKTVPRLECFPWDISGISSSTTT